MFFSNVKLCLSQADDSVPSCENQQEASKESCKNSAELSPLEVVEKELAEMKAKYEETYDRMLRIAAEAENTRKRLEKEKMDTRHYSIADFAKDLLPVVDAFDKAMATIDETVAACGQDFDPKMGAIVEGVQLVTKTFQDAIKKHGIERLPGKGEPFNPMYHNAIAKIVDPSLKDETVVDEFMAGYKISERVLRTAMVRVGAPE